jgi:DNA replication factor GINS
MIPSEREMYRIILSALEDCRRSTAETSGGPIRTAEDTAEKETESESFPERKDEYIIVRMLADVDAFLGVDGRTYSLKKEDVVSLPRINGEVLCDHNIALNIEPGS